MVPFCSWLAVRDDEELPGANNLSAEQCTNSEQRATKNCRICKYRMIMSVSFVSHMAGANFLLNEFSFGVTALGI